MLFNCKNKEIISIRETFEERFCKYVENFKTKSVSSKTLEIFNVMPTCHTSGKDNANSLIYKFVKKTPYITLKKNNVYITKDTEWELTYKT